MPYKNRHPAYAEIAPDWEVMRDTYRGERRIKERRTKYLPATRGQELDGMAEGQPGRISYNGYIGRAVFPDLVATAVSAMLGIMHAKPAKIELPARLEPLRERATVRGESLEILLRRINEAQLVTGRIGLLLDVPTGAPPKALPYIATYSAESIVNWDDGARDELVQQKLNLVVLDESEYERDPTDFSWSFKQKYRVLALGPIGTNEPVGQYRSAVFRDGEEAYAEEAFVVPSIGGRTLDFIPFEFINSKDLVSDPDDPPLLGLARLALAIYRSEADYRQALFMQAQDTLVIKGDLDDTKPVRAGAGAAIKLPADGDAKYIGTNSLGIPEMRQAIENDRRAAGEQGGRLLDNLGKEAEAAEALRIRVAARTATLNSVALTAAAGLQEILRKAALWVGADPAEVIVQPHLEFTDNTIDGRSLVDIMTAKAMGLPLSRRSVHQQMRLRGMTERTFEEELAEIEQEEPLGDSESEDDATA